MEINNNNSNGNDNDNTTDDVPMEDVDAVVDNNLNVDVDNGDYDGYDDDDDDDDAPLFVNEGDAVEVQVDDSNIPMDDDDDDADDDGDGDGNLQRQEEPIIDMSRVVITSHKDPVYAIASCGAVTTAAPTTTLRFVSGGGDDKAYWHEIPLLQQQQQQQQQQQPPSVAAATMVETIPLDTLYEFKDSISAIASNTSYIHFDTSKPPNPEWMAVGGLDGSVVLFNPENTDGGDAKMQILEGPSSDIEWMCWHPKGGNVMLVGCSDATIWMYHTTLRKCLQVFVGHEDSVTCGCFSADGRAAVSGSTDGTLRIWGPKTGKCKHVFRFPAGGAESTTSSSRPAAAITCMATHGGTDQQLIIVGSEDGQAHICHVSNKKHVTTLRHYDPHLHTNNSSGSSDTQSNNNIDGDGDDDDDEEIMMLPSSVEAVGFCKSNPNWCATGGMDGILKIWDLANQGQCRHSCSTGVGVRQSSSTEQQQQQQQQKSSSPRSSGGDGITKLTWHPTLPLVFTSTCRGQIHIWDARDGKLLHTLTGHSDVINDMDVTFLPSTTTATTTPTVDGPNPGVIAGFAGATTAGATGGGVGVGGYAIIVSASDDKTVRIFDVDIDAILQ